VSRTSRCAALIVHRDGNDPPTLAERAGEHGVIGHGLCARVDGSAPCSRPLISSACATPGCRRN